MATELKIPANIAEEIAKKSINDFNQFGVSRQLVTENLLPVSEDFDYRKLEAAIQHKAQLGQTELTQKENAAVQTEKLETNLTLPKPAAEKVSVASFVASFFYKPPASKETTPTPAPAPKKGPGKTQ